ncbi:DNA-binding response regulator [Clostridiales bacterium]|nr:DNA-binding response regulator [Clostridiales bacterium]
MRQYKILIIEDSREIREGIQLLFRDERYQLLEAASGGKGLELFSDEIDLVVLDIMMPGISGLRTCEEIRKRSNVPILFLTAPVQESDRFIRFMTDGDDYLTKPFSYVELLARIKALLRDYAHKEKSASPQVSEAEFQSLVKEGDIVINEVHGEVMVNGVKKELSHTECLILLLLMKNPQKVFSTKEIYESVWREPFLHISDNTVMVHVRNLRKKIEDDPRNPKYIRNVRGKGYQFGADD